MRPNLFIVGAAKAGTTSLHDALRQHPQVFMTTFKEPHFFAAIDDFAGQVSHEFVSEESQYLDMFAAANPATHQYAGESSTAYLWDETTPSRMHDFAPNAKIIISLREPVQRAFSHFLMDIKDGKQPEEADFLITVREDFEGQPRIGWFRTNLYLDLGFYHDQVSRYFQTFGRENVHVLLFEELISDFDTQLRTITEFLGIDAAEGITLSNSNPHGYPRSPLHRLLWQSPKLRSLARSVIPRSLKSTLMGLMLKPAAKPLLSNEARQFLRDLYRDDTTATAALIDRDLSHWLTDDEAIVPHTTVSSNT